MVFAVYLSVKRVRRIMVQNKRETGSFRDPSGFLFWRVSDFYCHTDYKYQENYDILIKSVAYQKLEDNSLLIPYQEVDIDPFKSVST
jgi:hypothetical protein